MKNESNFDKLLKEFPQLWGIYHRWSGETDRLEAHDAEKFFEMSATPFSRQTRVWAILGHRCSRVDHELEEIPIDEQKTYEDLQVILLEFCQEAGDRGHTTVDALIFSEVHEVKFQGCRARAVIFRRPKPTIESFGMLFDRMVPFEEG